jgi:hypothetical protein
MSFDPIPLEEFNLLLAEHVLRLDVPMFAKWERLGFTPQLVPCERKYNHAREAMYSVAREADDVLIYDDVEEEFGIGHLDADGVLRNWSTVGELGWALGQFPPTPEVSRPSA